MPKDNYSKEQTEEFQIPIYANGVKNKGIYGYTNFYKVNEPCVTISARGTLGYAEYRQEAFVPIVRLIVLIPNELAIPQYLKYAINNIQFTNTGSVIPQLTVPKVKNLEIPLPSIEEQQKLIKKVNKKEVEIKKIKNSLTSFSEEKEAVLRKYL